jgi:glutathione S-transferase
MDQLAGTLGSHRWLAGSRYSLSDAAAIPYIFRSRALGLESLWVERKNVVAWLDRALEHSEHLKLQDPWGSPSFHAMVANHARNARHDVRRMLDSASWQRGTDM